VELGEAPLEDFIQFFNNVMKIQDFKSFLQACHNVCIIKKKKVAASKSADGLLKETLEKMTAVE